MQNLTKQLWNSESELVVLAVDRFTTRPIVRILPIAASVKKLKVVNAATVNKNYI